MPKKSSAAIKKALAFLEKDGKRKPGRRTLERVPTGLIQFDDSVGGGLVKGRMYEVAGNESAGKTTFALEVIKAIQAAGLVAVFLDFEHALDLDYAEAIGVDVSEEKFIFDQPETLEDGLLVGYELIKSGVVGVVVIDSVAAMAPEKELEGSKAPAQQARALGPELRKYLSVLAGTGTIGLFINQTRVDFGKGSFTSITTPGGKALKFLASVRLFITAGKSKVYEDGIHTKIRVWKNKTSPNQRGLSEYEIRPMIGIMRDEELLFVAKEKGLITERAGIFKIKDKKIRGRAKILELLQGEAVQKWILSEEKKEKEEEKDE